MAGAYRGFAHANPVTYTLMMAPPAVPGATARSVRSSATFLSIVEQVAGPRHALLLHPPKCFTNAHHTAHISSRAGMSIGCS